jgi:arylsulfatase A-like enzyme
MTGPAQSGPVVFGLRFHGVPRTLHTSHVPTLPIPWEDPRPPTGVRRRASVRWGGVYRRLLASRFSGDTVVVYSSDHGEMLGAHGGMHQKWHNAYDESIRVPLLVSGPGIPAGGRIDAPSSHVDLVPTLLGLAGLDAEAIRAKLAGRFTEARPLVGRDLSPAIRDGRGAAAADEAIYFMTEDEVSEGLDQTSAIGRSYKAVKEPAKVEAVVARLDTGRGPRLWKYARSYEQSQIGDPEQSRSRRGDQELELYDLEGDPTEATNLAHAGQATGESRAAREQLERLLSEQRRKKALHPQHR